MSFARTSLVAFAACASLTTAHADPTKKPGKPSKPDPADVAYQDGRRHYDLREWDEAIESFKESYRLRADERSLFNIAQAYRLKGDCVEALGFYQTYKRNFPEAEGVAAVNKLLGDVETCARERAAAAAKPTTPPPVHETTGTEPVTPDSGESEHAPPHRHVRDDAADEESDRDPGKTKRVAGAVLGGVGVVAVLGGVAFAVHARSLSQQVESGGGHFDPMLEAAGNAANRNASVLFIVGGGTVVTGTILFLLGRGHDTASHVAIAPSSNGGSLLWRASF